MDSKMKAFCDLSIGVVIIKFILGNVFKKCLWKLLWL